MLDIGKAKFEVSALGMYVHIYICLPTKYICTSVIVLSHYKAVQYSCSSNGCKGVGSY